MILRLKEILLALDPFGVNVSVVRAIYTPVQTSWMFEEFVSVWTEALGGKSTRVLLNPPRWREDEKEEVDDARFRQSKRRNNPPMGKPCSAAMQSDPDSPLD